MKIGIVFYHKNAEKIYPREWTDKCVTSMIDAAEKYLVYNLRSSLHVNEIIFYELNYGDYTEPDTDYRKDAFSIIRQATGKMPGIFLRQSLKNYADAMNFIYAQAFSVCEVVFNTNADDWYDPDRMIKTMESLNEGYDIVSANYKILDRGGSIVRYTDFANLNIYEELCRENNVVSNPCHAMKKRVFEKLQFDSSLVPREDLVYWKKCIEEGFKIKILPDHLHYYRLHEKQSGNWKKEDWDNH